MDDKVLTQEEEFALLRLAQKGDLDSRNALVEANLHLVIPTAAKYFTNAQSHHMDLQLDDLVQEGRLGLFEAVRHFDFNKVNEASDTADTAFARYAKSYIKESILKSLWLNEQVKIPKRQYFRIFTIREKKDELTKKLGRNPTAKELAAALKMSEEEVIALEAFRTISLQTPVSEDGELTFADIYVEPNQVELGEDDGIYDADYAKNRIRAVTEAYVLLSEKEKEVVKSRVLCPEKKRPTRVELAERLGVTSVEVLRLENRAKQKLKEYFYEILLSKMSGGEGK